MSSTAPTDNLVRALIDTDAVHLRAAGDDEGRTLFGHFAVFNRWTEISSVREGRFLERIKPGAFNRTFTEHRSRIKVLYDHGKDPQLGNKPLGKLTDLREDEDGGYYEVDLLDAPYVNDFVIPAARAGLLGASFRFSIPAGGDEWRMRPGKSEHNPTGLPERDINDSDVFELGPVTFPAYESASAGVRSGTDDFIASLLHDPRFMARFVERAGLAVVERVLDDLPSTMQVQTPELPAPPQVSPERASEPDPDDPADGQPSPVQWTTDSRRRFARQIEAEHLGVGKENP